MKWSRVEKESSLPYLIIEYCKEGEECVIRQSYITYDKGFSYRKNGWDVICVDNDGEVKIEKIAWFRYLREAQFFVDHRRQT